MRFWSFHVTCEFENFAPQILHQDRLLLVLKTTHACGQWLHCRSVWSAFIWVFLWSVGSVLYTKVARNQHNQVLEKTINIYILTNLFSLYCISPYILTEPTEVLCCTSVCHTRFNRSGGTTVLLQIMCVFVLKNSVWYFLSFKQVNGWNPQPWDSPASFTLGTHQ